VAALGLALTVPAAAEAAVGTGDVLVTDGAPELTAGLIEVDPTSGKRTATSSNSDPSGEPEFVAPSDVIVTPDRSILVVDFDAYEGEGGVIVVDPITGTRTTLSANSSPTGGPAFHNPLGLTLETNGDVIVAEGQFEGRAAGALIRVDPTTGERTLLSSNSAPSGAPAFRNPTGVAIAADGAVLVADRGPANGPGAVLRVDPKTGARSLVSANNAPAGGPALVDPTGLALAANGDILVVDPNAFGGTGGVIRVDPATGARSAVSSNAFSPGGPSFANPGGIAVAANGDILVTDLGSGAGSGSVIRVNPATGARSTLSSNAAPSGEPGFELPSGLAVVPPARPPVLGKQVRATVVSGDVFVKLPRGSSLAAKKGKGYVSLKVARRIPVGSLLDTRDGKVRLVSARNTKGATQSGVFAGGIFQVQQSRRKRAKGLVTLRLKGGSFKKRCRSRKRKSRKSAAGGPDARVARRRRLRRRTVRRLRSRARGRYRTRGRHSSATVRGTTWTTTDRCDGTLTKVKRGKVIVRDFRRKKRITLRSGKSYLARA
jgi:hypothetical protein